jgi:molecular chaperone DnaJ
MSSRDFMEKDFYRVLGVAKDADAAEIKKAYRKLAREYHPDANKGDQAAEERFKEISEAYDVLADPKRRAEYDEMRTLFANGGPRMRTGGSGAEFNFDLGDLFGNGGGLGDVFGGMFGGRGGQGRSAPKRGSDLATEVTISFREAIDGTTIPITLNQRSSCRTCQGTGAAPGSSPRTCSACGGAGQVSRNAGGFAFPEPCRQCRGRGSIIESPCPECQGSGETARARTITARVPAGVNDGAKIRLKGKGAPGERGAPAGDLHVTIHVRSHPLFGRKGDHLTITVPVTFVEATLGADIDVPTLDESTVKVRIAPGTANGRTLRVKGRGIARGATKGDLLVTIEVAVPQRLEAAEREALEKYAAVSAHHNPREGMREGRVV